MKNLGKLKIILTGAHGTGKSAVAEGLRKLGYDVMPSMQRKVIEQDKSICWNDNGNEYSQSRFMFAYLSAMSNKQKFIADRGPIDVVAYTKVLMDQGNVSPEFWRDQMMQLVEFEDFKNIVYFYFPVCFPIVKDGVRSEDIEYQKAVDEALYNLTHGPTRQVYDMPDSSIEERVKFVDSTIQQLIQGRQ